MARIPARLAALAVLTALAVQCGSASAARAAGLIDAVAVPLDVNIGRRLMALPNLNRTLTAPSNCSGWPEFRVYTEAQAWFTRPGANIDVESSHLHVGACAPQRQSIKGDFTVHVLVQKHQFPDNKTEPSPVNLQIELTTDVAPRTQTKYTISSSALSSRTTRWDCNADKTLCKGVAEITIKTLGSRVFVPDGFTKMTIFATTTLNDGKAPRSMQARIDSFFLVNNKGNQPPINRTILGVDELANTGFPWGYTHAPFTANLPIAPVSGMWTVGTRHFTAGQASVTSNVTGVFVSIDPNFHNPTIPDFTGKQILVNIRDTSDPSARPWCPIIKGHIDCAFTNNITINTTSLTDGLHKLFIRTDSFVDPSNSILINQRGNGGTFSSVTLLVFRVCNNPNGCSSDVTVPADEQPPPPIPDMKPPPEAAFYNGSQPLPPQARAADAPYDCSGWLGKRVYIEGQTWFTRPGNQVGINSTQLHVGACLPHRDTIAGQFPIDVLLQKYNFPSKANETVGMKIAFFWKGGNVSFELAQTGSAKGWACRNNAPVCKVVYRTVIDTRPPNLAWMVPDGLNRVEITANVGFHDGVTWRTIMARSEAYMWVSNTGLWPANFTDKLLPPGMLTRTFFPWSQEFVSLNSDLPMAPITGPTTFKMGFTHGGRTGANVTGVYAAIDPSPLLLPTPYPGSVLVNASTSYGLPLAPFVATAPAVPANCAKTGGDNGSLACTVTFSPSDVARDCAFNPCNGGLCDGSHRLFMRVDSYVEPTNPMFRDLPAAGQVGAGTLSTVLVVPFKSQIGAAVDGACAASPVRARAASADGGDATFAPMSAKVVGILSRGMVGAASTGRGVDAANAIVRAADASLGAQSLKLMVGRAKRVAPDAAGSPEEEEARAAVFL